MDENFGVSMYTSPVTSIIHNVATTNLKLSTNVASQFVLEVLSGSCNISAMPSVNLMHPVSAIVGVSITTTISLPAG